MWYLLCPYTWSVGKYKFNMSITEVYPFLLADNFNNWKFKSQSILEKKGVYQVSEINLSSDAVDAKLKDALLLLDAKAK